MKYFITLVAALLVICAACGKSELNYTGTPPADSNRLDLVPTVAPETVPSPVPLRKGTLILEPNNIAKSGIVSFTIFANGSVEYEGLVSFLGSDNRDAYSWSNRTPRYSLSEVLPEISVPFKGGFRVDEPSVKSVTYKERGAIHEDREVRFEVVGSEGVQRTISAGFLPQAQRNYHPTNGSQTDHNATGILNIDVSGEIVDILNAELHGTAFLVPLTLRFKKFEEAKK